MYFRKTQNTNSPNATSYIISVTVWCRTTYTHAYCFTSKLIKIWYDFWYFHGENTLLCRVRWLVSIRKLLQSNLPTNRWVCFPSLNRTLSNGGYFYISYLIFTVCCLTGFAHCAREAWENCIWTVQLTWNWRALSPISILKYLSRRIWDFFTKINRNWKQFYEFPFNMENC